MGDPVRYLYDWLEEQRGSTVVLRDRSSELPDDAVGTAYYTAGESLAKIAQEVCIPEVERVRTHNDAVERHLSQHYEDWVVAELKAERYRQVGFGLVDGDADVGSLTDTDRLDMSLKVLDGRLGEICSNHLLGPNKFPVAYAWPALVTTAAPLVKFAPGDPLRTNIYTGLVGDPGSGKSSARTFARYFLNVHQPQVQVMLAGSIEGLVANLGDDGQAAIYSPDELSHLLTKANISHASFPYVLNTMFYEDYFSMTVSQRKKLEFRKRLSVLGGLVEKNFDEGFGAATTAGLYDRFLFGLCPTGFKFLYRPPSGNPCLPEGELGGTTSERFDLPRINDNVWDERDRLVLKEGFDKRVVEICLRVAAICAAVDGKPELKAEHLGPMRELIIYQEWVRKILAPNAGKRDNAIVAEKIVAYLQAHGPNGEWFPRRDILKNAHVYEFGPAIYEPVMSYLVKSERIDEKSASWKSGARKKVIRLRPQ